VKLYIFKADTDLSVCSVRANLGDLAKRVMLDCLDELKDFVVSGNKDIAFLEVWS